MYHRLLRTTVLALATLSTVACADASSIPQQKQHPMPTPQGAQTAQATATPTIILVYQPLWVTEVVKEPQFIEFQRAIAVAYTIPEFRAIADAAYERRVPVHWGTTRNNALAEYHIHTNTIVVSNGLKGASISLLAAIISHEAVHLLQKHGDGGLCLQNEIEAFAMQALVYEQLREKYRSTVSDYREQFHEELVRARRENRLIAFILDMPAYRQICRFG